MQNIQGDIDIFLAFIEAMQIWNRKYFIISHNSPLTQHSFYRGTVLALNLQKNVSSLFPNHFFIAFIMSSL